MLLRDDDDDFVQTMNATKSKICVYNKKHCAALDGNSMCKHRLRKWFVHFRRNDNDVAVSLFIHSPGVYSFSMRARVYFCPEWHIIIIPQNTQTKQIRNEAQSYLFVANAKVTLSINCFHRIDTRRHQLGIVFVIIHSFTLTIHAQTRTYKSTCHSAPNNINQSSEIFPVALALIHGRRHNSTDSCGTEKKIYENIHSRIYERKIHVKMKKTSVTSTSPNFRDNKHNTFIPMLCRLPIASLFNVCHPNLDEWTNNENE